MEIQIFRCKLRDIKYAMEAISIVKHEEDNNPLSLISEDAMISFLSKPYNYIIVALFQRKVVGYIVAYELEKAAYNTKHMFFYEIEVLKKYRRNGIGYSLVEYLKNMSRRKNIAEIFVITDSSNKAARALYKKAGGKYLTEKSDDLIFNWIHPF